MRKGTVFSIKNLKIIDFLLKNNILVIMVLIFISGIAIGTFNFERFDILYKYSENYIKEFSVGRIDASFLSVTFHSFMAALSVILIIFVSGTSMLGVVLVPVVFAFRGMLYGSVTAFLYSEYSIKGVAFNAVMIIPSAIVFIVSMLLASRESIKFSIIIAKLSLPKMPPVNLYRDFKNYCGRYLIICSVVLVSAIIDAALSCSFIGNFIL